MIRLLLPLVPPLLHYIPTIVHGSVLLTTGKQEVDDLCYVLWLYSARTPVNVVVIFLRVDRRRS